MSKIDSGAERVSQVVMQMDQITQQNAALVEQAAAAAESLQSRSAALVQSVAVFKLENATVESRQKQSGERLHGSGRTLLVGRAA